MHLNSKIVLVVENAKFHLHSTWCVQQSFKKFLKLVCILFRAAISTYLEVPNFKAYIYIYICSMVSSSEIQYLRVLWMLELHSFCMCNFPFKW